MGNKKTDAEKRRRLRQRLAALGVPAEEIEQQVALIQGTDLAKRESERAQRVRQVRGKRRKPQVQREQRPLTEQEEQDRREAEARRLQLEEETYARLCPDDRGFRPRKPDPLLVGAARATGVAAKAVKRGKTVTKWQADELEARG